MRELIKQACNDPQRMKARRLEADILAKMPLNDWLSCTAISRLIRSADERRTRARLDRLVRDGRVERKRGQGVRGAVYLFRRYPAVGPTAGFDP